MSVSLLVRTEVRAMSTADLDSLIDLCRARRLELDAQASQNFRTDDRVRFIGGGRVTFGYVARMVRGGKLEIDRCSDGCTWRMPASMLEHA